MADRITIPAACLEALGGLHEDDPPVLVADPAGRRPSAWHPIDGFCDPLDPDDRILVRQSAPAPAEVLRRRTDALSWTPGIPRLDILADLFVREAIAAHGSDPGWSVEVTRG